MVKPQMNADERSTAFGRNQYCLAQRRQDAENGREERRNGTMCETRSSLRILQSDLSDESEIMSP